AGHHRRLAAVTLREISERLGCRLEGDGALPITGVAGLESAGPGDLTFFSNPRYAPALRATNASAVILPDDGTTAPCAILRSPQPYLSFAQALAFFPRDQRPAAGAHPTAVVDSTAVIGEGVSIGPLAVIGSGAQIGARTVIHAHVVVGPGVR